MREINTTTRNNIFSRRYASREQFREGKLFICLIRRSHGLSEGLHGGHNLQRRQSYRVRQVEEGPIGGDCRDVGLLAGIRRHEEHGSQLCRGRRLRRHSAPHSALRFEVYTESTAFRCNAYTRHLSSSAPHRDRGKLNCRDATVSITAVSMRRKALYPAGPLYRNIPGVIHLIVLIRLITFVVISAQLYVHS